MCFIRQRRKSFTERWGPTFARTDDRGVDGKLKELVTVVLAFSWYESDNVPVQTYMSYAGFQLTRKEISAASITLMYIYIMYQLVINVIIIIK